MWNTNLNMVLSKQSLAERSQNNSICSEQFEWWKQKDTKLYWTQNQLGPFHTFSSDWRLHLQAVNLSIYEILKITLVNILHICSLYLWSLLSLCAYVHHVKMMEFPMKYVKQIVHAYLQPHLKTSWNCFKIISSSRQLSFQSWTCEYIRLVHGTFCCRAPEQGG